MEKLKSYTTGDRADAFIRIVHPTIAAERLGITVKQVMARRAELGLPPVEVQFAKGEQGAKHSRDSN
jgi:hypothetical protein